MKLQDLIKAREDAENALEEANDTLKDYLKPIVEAYAGRGLLRLGDLYRIDIHKNEVSMTFRYDASGGPYDTDFRLPLMIFEAQSETAEAKAWKDANDQATETKRRHQVMAEIERLKRELGE